MKPEDLARRIGSIGLLRGLEGADRDALISELSAIQLAAGETLFRQGDDANSLFLILEGRLRVVLEQENESEQLLNELGAGDVVGEVALVAGGKRSATVKVVEAASLAELSVATLDGLLGRSSEISARMVDLVTRRLRRSQLAHQLSNLFAGLDDETLAEIEQEIEWVSLPAGEMLYAEGDPGDAAYLVVSGRVRVEVHHPESRVVDEVGRGDMVGELALLEEVPRQSTVFAARDTDLARFPRAAFEKLLARHPMAMLGVARTVFRRTRASSSQIRRQAGEKLSIAVMPAAPGISLGRFVADLVAALGKHGEVAHLDAERVDALLQKPGIAHSIPSEPAHIRLVQWLHEVEDRNRFVLYVADPTRSQWSERAIRQADYLLTVGDARSVEPPGDTERFVESNRSSRHPRWGLALLHEPEVVRPSGTSRWLEKRDVESVFHLRRGSRADTERLARILAGTAVGVVFGGGGARGFAHLGVLRALDELGIAVDMVGGTSMGAPMASCPARGMTAAEALAEARTGYVSLLDYTLPLVSLMSGFGITSSIVEALGDWDIEDLWLPYFCVSTNISRAGQVVHRRGSLSRAVRASVAIPGVLPPVPEGPDLLVDGGVLNNLPIDVMRELNPSGPLIAVDVVPTQGPAAKSDYGLALSGWQLALARILPWQRSPDAPTIGTTLLRSMLVGADSTRQRLLREKLADLYINVRMSGVGLLDFEAIEPIQQLGYEQGLEALQAWLDGKDESWRRAISRPALHAPASSASDDHARPGPA